MSTSTIIQPGEHSEEHAHPGHGIAMVLSLVRAGLWGAFLKPSALPVTVDGRWINRRVSEDAAVSQLVWLILLT